MLRIFFILSLFFISLVSANNETFLCQFGPNGRAADGKMNDSLYIFISVPAEYTGPLYIRIFDADCGGKWDEKYGQWDVQTVYQLFGGTQSELSFENRNTHGNLLDSKEIGESLNYDNRWQTIFSINTGKLPVSDKKKWLKLRIKSISGNDANLFLFQVSRSSKENNPIGEWFCYRPTIRINKQKNIVSYLPFSVPSGTEEIIIYNFDADNDIINLITPIRSGIKINSSGNADYRKTRVILSADESGKTLSLISGLGLRPPNNNEGFYILSTSGKNLPFMLPFYQGGQHRRPAAKFSYYPLEETNGIAFDASGSNLYKSEIGQYTWNFGDGSSARGLQVSHVYPKPGIYKTTLSVSDQSSFVDNKDFITKSIFVNAPPMAKLKVPSITALGQKIILDASDSYDPDGKIIKYIWDIMGEKTSTQSPKLSYRFNLPGKYTVKLIVNDNAGYPNSISTDIKEIIVNSAPIASFTAAKKGAVNEIINFDASASSDSDGEITHYQWDFGDGTKAEGKITQHQYNKPGSYKIKLSVSDNSDVANNRTSTSVKIIINSPPIADAGTNKRAAAGDKILFSAAKSYDSDGKIISYQWDFGDGTSGEGVRAYHAYTSPGDYSVTLSVTDNSATKSQTSTAAIKVHINFPPVAVIKAPSLITINPVQFDASQSYDSDGKILQYFWSFGDGKTGTGQKIKHSFVKPGSYTVTLKIKDDSKTVSQTVKNTHKIIVNALPIAKAGNDILTAPNEEFQLDGSSSTDPDGQISIYHWFLNGEQISANAKLKYTLNKSGIYSFLLKVADNSNDPLAVDYDEIQVTVNAPPYVTFITPERLDPKKTYRFSAENCYDPDGDALNFTWVLNDKQFKGKFFSHNFSNEGIYSLTLIADDGRGLSNSKQEIKKTVWVNNRPVALAGNDILTNNFGITLDASASSDPDGDLLSYQWILGDGTVLNGVKIYHQYNEGGIFPVRLIVSDGKGFSNSKTIDNLIVHINRPPIADAGGNISSCAGCTVLFDGSASFDEDKDLLKYHWDFGDGSSSEEMSPVHRYEKKGLYRVRLKVTDNSDLPGNESYDDILATIFDSPVASFTVDRETTCINRPVKFDASASTDIDGVVNAFLWDFGDGKTGSGEKIIHSYEMSGVYKVRLKIIGNEQKNYKNYDYFEMEVKVIEGPKAAFTLLEKGCIGQNITFDASASKSNSGKIVSYEWDFGDGAISTEKTTKHSFKKWGIYPIKLTIKSDSGSTCFKSSIVKSITINDAPQAEITAADTIALKAYTNFSVTNIKDEIGGITSFSWIFPNDTIVRGPFIRRVFTKSGRTDYKLIIKDAMELPCSKTEYSKSIYVNFPPSAAFNIKSATFLAGEAVFLDASSTTDKENNILTYQWKISDGNTLTGKTSQFIPETQGEYQITLQVSDGYNIQEITKNIMIKSMPEINISVTPLICPLNKYRISAATSYLGSLNYLWTLPDGTTLKGKTIKYKHSDSRQSALIKLKIDGKNINPIEKGITITPDPLPTADFTISGEFYTGSATDYLLFDASSCVSKNGKPLTFYWNFGDGSKSYGQKIRHHFKKPGKYKVVLTINDSNKKCRAVMQSKIIEIKRRTQ
jgi:PKD repeat protein